MFQVYVFTAFAGEYSLWGKVVPQTMGQNIKKVILQELRLNKLESYHQTI